MCYKMKSRISIVLGLTAVLGVMQAAEKPAGRAAWRLLEQHSYFAKAHYNGIPDVRAIGVQANRNSVNRASVLERTRSIVIPEIQELEGFTMTEFMSYFDDIIRANDPTGVGINLIFNPHLPPSGANAAGNAGGVAAGAPLIDPNNGLPFPMAGGFLPGAPGAAFSPDDEKIVGLKIKLRNLTVLQIFEAVTQSFATPIQYVITDYGVVFQQKPADQVGYSTRRLRVTPNAFSQGPSQPATVGGSVGGGNNPDYGRNHVFPVR